jgi:hypothetical protein
MKNREANMTTTTLESVQGLIDKLTPLEQVRLLEYLTPRIIRAVATRLPAKTVPSSTANEAWQTFFRIGDALAASDRPEMPTLTQTVQMMRR